MVNTVIFRSDTRKAMVQRSIGNQYCTLAQTVSDAWRARDDSKFNHVARTPLVELIPRKHFCQVLNKICPFLSTHTPAVMYVGYVGC